MKVSGKLRSVGPDARVCLNDAIMNGHETRWPQHIPVSEPIAHLCAGMEGRHVEIDLDGWGIGVMARFAESEIQ